MLWKSKWLLVSAAALAAASLMVSGCFGKTRERELQETADAINAAIEHDLALDRYEFTVSKGAFLMRKTMTARRLRISVSQGTVAVTTMLPPPPVTKAPL